MRTPPIHHTGRDFRVNVSGWKVPIGFPNALINGPVFFPCYGASVCIYYFIVNGLIEGLILISRG